MLQAAISQARRRRETGAAPPPSGNLLYLNTITGNNSNSGLTAGSPLLTLTELMGRLGSTGGIGRIDTNGIGALAVPLEDQILFTTAGLPIALEGVDRNPFLWYACQQETGWTSDGGGIYHKTISGYAGTTNGVMVSTLTDGYGLWLRLRRNTATPTTPAAGEFGRSGTTLYIHLPGDVNPTLHGIYGAKRNYCLICYNNSAPVTIRDAIGVGGNISCFRAGNSGSSGYLTCENVIARYAGSGGCFATDGGVSTLDATDCIGEGSYNDGFNIHATADGPTVATLVRCIGRYDDDEGGSPHENCIYNDTDGYYHHNGGGGITGVGTSEMNLLRTILEYNQQTANPTQQTTEAGLCFYDTGMSGSLTDVIVRNNPYAGVRNNAGASVIVTNLTSGVAQGNGLPDVGV